MYRIRFQNTHTFTYRKTLLHAFLFLVFKTIEHFQCILKEKEIVFNLFLYLISNHLECLNRIMDEFSTNYDNIIFLGGFNTCINNNVMTSFCSLNNLTSLIDQPTCYKNSNKPRCIDLILTNRPNYFQQSDVFETGLSDFYMMVGTELKIGFQKLKPNIVIYRDYRHFDNEEFWSNIQSCAS